MSVITRKDGQEYVIKPIREIVDVKGRGKLLSEIRNLSKEYGDYCHIRKLQDSRYSLTFHLEEGYLLGEAVADYFGYPEDLLWCEEIGQGNDGETRVAIVIIRNHQIMLDAEMPATAVADDISLALGGGEEQFDVYTFGNVPVKQSAEQADFNDVALDETRINDFVELQQGIIDLLEVKPAYQLASPHRALRNAGFRNHSLSAVFVLLALAPAVYYFSIYEKPKEETVVIDNFKDYRAAISGVQPAAVLLSLEYYFKALQDLPSWSIKQVVSTGDKLSYQLTSVSQKYDRLFDFSDTHNGRLSLNNSESTLVLPTIALGNPSPEFITDELGVTAHLAEVISVNPFMDVVTGAPSSTGHYQSRELKILLKGAGNVDLQWLAGVIDGYPMVITELNLTADGFAVDGNITTTIYGY